MVHTTADEVQALAEKKFGVTFGQKLATIQGPKLNDWKPAHGVLFEDSKRPQWTNRYKLRRATQQMAWRRYRCRPSSA